MIDSYLVVPFENTDFKIKIKVRYYYHYDCHKPKNKDACVLRDGFVDRGQAVMLAKLSLGYLVLLRWVRRDVHFAASVQGFCPLLRAPPGKNHSFLQNKKQ